MTVDCVLRRGLCLPFFGALFEKIGGLLLVRGDAVARVHRVSYVGIIVSMNRLAADVYRVLVSEVRFPVIDREAQVHRGRILVFGRRVEGKTVRWSRMFRRRVVL